MVHRRRPRRGKIALMVLVLLPMLFLCVSLAIFSSQAVDTRTEMQNGTDAAALAAAQGLVDDDMLCGDEAGVRRVLAGADEDARFIARGNLVQGEPLDLLPNPRNRHDGDVVLGYLDWPVGADFVPADLDAHRGSLHLVNCVRVSAQRTRERGNPVYLLGGPFLTHIPTDFMTVATAMLDRQVVGFRPVHDRPLPLVPLGIRSDRSGADERCWEYHVDRRRGPDHWAFDRDKKQFVPAERGDGLHEIELTFDREQPELCLLQMGAKSPKDLIRQVAEGVRGEDLADFGGEFLLGRDNERIAPGTWHCCRDGGVEAALVAGLERLRQTGEVRVWPLFHHRRAYQGMPVVTGFVAARVVKLSRNDGRLTLVLSPAVLSTASAVTAYGAGRGPETPANPYVCKIRLVD